jgi:hypothetical protein
MDHFAGLDVSVKETRVRGHHAGLRKPVSVTHRTGLGHAETEIGKWRAETGAAKPSVLT